MGTLQAKQLAHELTIEYIRANPTHLCDTLSNIPNIVDRIAEINQLFYESIINHEVLSKLY